MSTKPSTNTCPNCGTAGSGKFCTECGAALLGVPCASCGTLLTPGAHFCHKCGTTVGGVAGTPRGVAAAPTAAGSRSVIPWVVGAGALLALVIFVAAQQAKAPPAAGATTALDAPFAAGGGAMRAPDISNMSPRERADRLYDRVMTMSAAGKADSAAFFASMAVGAYDAIRPLDNDLRYDMGRMAEMANDLVVAQAQADTILQENPDHLLGLFLSSRVADVKGDKAKANALLKKVVAASKTELAKSLEEYARHENDLKAILAAVK